MEKQHRIEWLKTYIEAGSFSGTAEEQLGSQWFIDTVGSLPWFKEHPDSYGLWPCAGDPLGRTVPWAFLPGKSKETIVFYHHLDVVGIEDYGQHQGIALKSDLLKDAYRKEALDPDSEKDLLTESWLFGRGSCDMKGGGIAQLGLLEDLALSGDSPLSVLVVAVPDEENLSLGMRNALPLLKVLKDKYQLSYCLAVNSEPGFGRTDDALALYTGSAGKMTVLSYVQGFQCHSGSPFEGLNAASLLGALTSGTENHPDLSDEDQGVESSPPVWAMARDRKTVFDVSLPETAYGAMNLLYLKTGAKGSVLKLSKLFEAQMTAFLETRRSHYRVRTERRGQPTAFRDFAPRVCFFEDLWKRAESLPHEEHEALLEKISALKDSVFPEKGSFFSVTAEVISVLLQALGDREPLVILALVPPIYPVVSLPPTIAQTLASFLKGLAENQYQSELVREPYFMGISDMSYCNLQGDSGLESFLERNLPVWSQGYSIPLEEMALLNLPTINMGPRGKDLHQKTERVFLPDVVEILPKLYRDLIDEIAANPNFLKGDTLCGL